MNKIISLFLVLSITCWAAYVPYPLPTKKGGTGLSISGTAGNQLISNGTIWTTGDGRGSGGATNLGIFSSTSVTPNALFVQFTDSTLGTLSSSNPAYVTFRNTSSAAQQGLYSVVAYTSSSSITVPSTASLGSISGTTWQVFVYALNDTTPDICVSSSLLSEVDLQGSTQVSGSSNSATTLYCSASHSGNKAIRLVGKVGGSFANPNWSSLTRTASFGEDNISGVPGISYPGLPGILNFVGLTGGGITQIGASSSGYPINLSSGDFVINNLASRNIVFGTNNTFRGAFLAGGGLRVDGSIPLVLPGIGLSNGTLRINNSGNVTSSLVTQHVVSFSFPGSFTFNTPSDVNVVIACGHGGGGGGGSAQNVAGGDGGNGGGGAATSCQPIAVVPGTAYTITVGSGGAGATTCNFPGNNGNPTSFGGLFTWGGAVGGYNSSVQTALGDLAFYNNYGYPMTGGGHGGPQPANPGQASAFFAGGAPGTNTNCSAGQEGAGGGGGGFTPGGGGGVGGQGGGCIWSGIGGNASQCFNGAGGSDGAGGGGGGAPAAGSAPAACQLHCGFGGSGGSGGISIYYND